MPSQIRRRPTSTNYDAPPPHNTQRTAAASLAGFTLLPFELRQLIIEVACHSSSSSSSSLSPFPADNGTMYSLALVCREINAQVTPFLWGTVAITRPSALYALKQAVTAKPERAYMISSLHIGPQDRLPSYWWPLSRTFVKSERQFEGKLPDNDFTPPNQWIKSSLDAKHLPLGCEDQAPWSWDRRPPGCRGAAVFEALEVIQDSLGLSLEDHGVPKTKSIAPVFEAQATLDAYLEHLRSLEEQDDELARLAKPGARIPLRCRNGKCDHCPALYIKDAPTRSSTNSSSMPTPLRSPPSKAFIVPYSQILCRLAQRGAVTDRFDHPLILSRSGFQITVSSYAASGPLSYYPTTASYEAHSTDSFLQRHETFTWAGLKILTQAALANIKGPYYAALITATVSQVLRLARCVLEVAANVKNLSLTGFLDGSLYAMSKGALPCLRRVSLGPFVPCWEGSPPFDWLGQIEELRVCGMMMSHSEARYITGRIPGLKKLDWVMQNPLSPGLRPGQGQGRSIAPILDVLLKDSFFSHVAAVRAAAQSSAQDTSRVPLIVARLHASQISAMLRTASSAEERKAWLHGEPFSNQRRRLLLLENDFWCSSSTDSSNDFWKDMYEDNRAYWRKGIGEDPAPNWGEEES